MSRVFDFAALISGKYRSACLNACEGIVKNPSSICWLALAVFIVGTGHEAHAAAGTPISACKQLLDYIENGFASLVAAAAGLGAIVAAAVGGFKAAWALIVVSIGAFILRSYIGLFLTSC